MILLTLDHKFIFKTITMEDLEPLDRGLTDNLTVSADIKTFLTETAKWSGMLAIVGFVMMALMVLGMLGMLIGFAGSGLTSMLGAGSVGALIPVILIFCLYFFPIFYLYQFSKNMKLAIASNDQSALYESFKNLKSHYKFVGIFMLIIFGFYFLGFLSLLFVG